MLCISLIWAEMAVSNLPVGSVLSFVPSLM